MRISLRSIALAIPVVSAIFVSQPAFAMYFWEMKTLTYNATLTSNGQSTSITTPSTSTTFAPLFQADQALFDAVSNQVNTQVGSTLPPMIAAGGGTLQGYSTSLTGPINIGVTPTGAINISGMTMGINFSVYNSGWLGPIKVGVTCNFSEVFTSPTVTGAFNISAGTLSALSVTLGSPAQTVNCTSDLGGVPFLGDLIAGEAQDKASQAMQQGLAKMTSFNLNTAGGVNSGFGGLASGIPGGVFVINNVDYGTLLRNNLPSIIASGGITASFYNPSPYAKVGTFGTEGHLEVDYNQIVVSLPGENLQFSLMQDAVYIGIWRCPVVNKNCGAPP